MSRSLNGGRGAARNAPCGIARLLPLLCLAVMAPLTACGGGGGGGGDAAPQPPAPQPPAPEQPASPDPEPDPEPQTPEPDPEPAEPVREEPAPRDPPPEDIVVVPPSASVPASPPPSSDPPPASDPAPPPLPTAADFDGHEEYCAGPVRIDDTIIPCTNWGLRAVGAADAYARIAEREGAFVAPGSGVTVGFIDTGIDRGHWEFDASRVPDQIIIGGDGDVSGTSVSHGTQVASTVGARRDGAVPLRLAVRDFHGVAWGARLQMFAISLGSGRLDYAPVTVDTLKDVLDGWLAPLLREALKDSHGVDILNMSFSVQGLAENYDADDITDALNDSIAAAAQSGRDDADKTLLVWSAGNAHGTPCDADAGLSECVDGKVVAGSPAVANALPVFVEALRGHSVSVAATQPDGALAGFSNRCGKAAKWCIAAPGARMALAFYGRYEDRDTGRTHIGARGYSLRSGTSFSAPLVAGGLAVLKHYFRNQLGNTELLARLYATADVTPDPVADGAQCPAWLDLDGDLSDCELSSTHGRGLMDLDAATRPVGTTFIALGSALGGDGAPAPASLLRGGAAAGDALSSAFRGREMAVFDSLGAPFWLDMDGFARAAARPAIGERLARFTAGGTATGVSGGATVAGGVVDLNLASARLRIGVNRPGGDDWPDGHASLVPVREGGVSLTLGRGALRASAFAAAPPRRSHWWAQDTAPRPTAAGAELAWAPRDSAFALRLGSVREFESALGATGTGAFGRLESGLVFAGVGARGAVEGWSVAAGAELGVAAPQASRGLVSDVSSLATSAFSVSAERPVRDGGRLRLSLSQPLRVESGRMRLSVPVGRTKHGGVARRLVDAPLSPSGRQLDLAADWRAPVDAAGGEARLGATLSVHPGHAVGDAPELVLLAGYRLPF